jgi:hypothetical protein
VNDALTARSDSYGEYRAALVRRFWDYATTAGLRPDLFEQTYESNPHRPPVFRPSEWHRNLVLPPGNDGEEVLEYLQQRPPHRWFRSMTSSQALTWSVFGSLAALKKLDVLSDLIDPDAMAPVFPTEALRGNECQVEYEVDFLGEPRPTSVDVMLGDEAGPRVAVECKLSESDVGTCSRPRLGAADPKHCNGKYCRQRGRTERCSLTELKVKYWLHLPNLTSWRADRDMATCPLRATYQLARNVLAVCARPDGSTDLQRGHCVLLVDERNPAFREGGRGCAAVVSFAASLREARLLRLVSWQDVLGRMRADPQLGWLTDGLRSKYGF